MTHTSNIVYESPRKICIGDVFYKIKAVDPQVFRDPCLVCKDEKKLTINGITFDCPCCRNTQEVIRINKFVVQRYRVFKITDEVNNSEWKPGDRHHVEFGIYRKIGHGYQWAEHTESKITERGLRLFLNLSEEKDINKYRSDDLIFDDYQLAVRVAKTLTEKELQRLAEYNLKHGADHKAEFKTENDAKSK